MELTYILVDLENVRPSAQDIARVRGDQYRLLIFHGPQQKKFDADVVQAWQPLGDKVQFIQCPKSGRNALDMHIAFHIGLIVEGHNKAGSSAHKSFRVVVISNDTDFDPLLQYLRTLDYPANRSATIRALLGAAPGASESEKAGGKAAKAKTVEIPQPAAKKAARAKTATPAKQAGRARKAEARKADERKGAAKKAQRKEDRPSVEKAAAPDRLEKLIEHLHSHPKNRPTKRKALEKHIASVLRGKVDADAVPDLIGELERRGVTRISGTKIEYPLWSAEEK